MSKPDAAGGSLENILASIRKNLSEQSTDALSEPSATSVGPDKNARPGRKGLTQRLAGANTTTASDNSAHAAADDLSDLLEASAVAPSQASVSTPAPSPATATPPAEVPAEKDPLWFLTRREEPAPETDLPPLAATPSGSDAKTAVAEPALTRPEVLRASMPPFFGSSAETVKPASTPAEVATPGATDPQTQLSPSPASPTAPTHADSAMAREVSLVAAAAEVAVARPPEQSAPQPVPNGKGASASTIPPEAALTADTPLTRALEATVLDLLKPMLSQWLDQNMPRLVAEALEEEVRRTRGGARDAKKT